MATEHAIGIDIGGTGIKGAVIDLATGELVTERSKVRTPEGGRPADLLRATVELLAKIDDRPLDARAPDVDADRVLSRHGATLSRVARATLRGG